MSLRRALAALVLALALVGSGSTATAGPPRGSLTRTWIARPGDTPESVARRFHMPVADLRRLNPELGADLAVGSPVVVQLPMPVGTRVGSAVYRRPGGSGPATAGARPPVAGPPAGGYALPRRYAAQRPAELELPAGTGAVASVIPRYDGPVHRGEGAPPLVAPPSDARGVAEGAPQDGALRDPVRLPAAPGIHLRRPERAFGTGRLVQVLLHAVAAVERKYPETQVIAIGDLSAPAGGPLPGHRSHQNGRDADVAFYTLDESTDDRFVAVTPGNLDAARTWAFIEALLDTGDLRFVFIDHALQAPLYEYAAAHASPRWRTPDALARVFQYPMPEWTAVGIIRHEPHHRDHLHFRIVDPDDTPDLAAR